MGFVTGSGVWTAVSVQAGSTTFPVKSRKWIEIPNSAEAVAIASGHLAILQPATGPGIERMIDGDDDGTAVPG